MALIHIPYFNTPSPPLTILKHVVPFGGAVFNLDWPDILVQPETSLNLLSLLFLLLHRGQERGEEGMGKGVYFEPQLT